MSCMESKSSVIFLFTYQIERTSLRARILEDQESCRTQDGSRTLEEPGILRNKGGREARILEDPEL